MCWKWADSFESSKKTISSSFPQRSKNVLRSSSVSLKLIPGFHVKLGHFATGWEKQSTPLLFGKKNKKIYIYIKFNTSVEARGGGRKTRPTAGSSLLRGDGRRSTAALTFLFSLVCFLLFTVLHLDCTPLHFSLTDAFFFSLIIIFLRIEKREEKRKKNKVPFLRDDVLFPFFADQIPMPPSHLPYFFIFF